MTTIYLLTQLTEKLHMTTTEASITDLQFIRPNEEVVVGAIFYGRITDVDHQLQASFVDIGLSTPAYLDHRDYNKADVKSGLTEGQYIIVQVTKSPYLTKGARLSRKINLTEGALVYLPYDTHVNVSRKLSDERRSALYALLDPQLQAGGVVVRTKADTMSDQTLLSQLETLYTRFQDYLTQANEQKKPGQLSQKSEIHMRYLENNDLAAVDHIIVDDVKLKRQIEATYKDKVKVQVKQSVIQTLAPEITDYIERLSTPVIAAGLGVELVVEQTEAMTVIDVNSHSYTSNQSRARSVVAINKQAANQVAKVIRQRNLSGMIVIDFIRMTSKRDQQAVMDTLKKATEQDKQPVKLYGFTRLGLYELTRKREATSVMYTLFDQGVSALSYKLETQCYELERRLVSLKSDAAIIAVSPSFYLAFCQYVDQNVLSERTSANLYFSQDESTSSFSLLRSGTQALIDAFLLENQSKTIDKL
ncbi:ribonuclease G [Halolactibacillus halophilus]|uniref:Ribonuclease E n=1 Tax=Halolactibacillus halophilus TaxID=306540 RepID=A0A1I5KZT2_9BACI|nr:ribonuclease E/G [Halolactibacillus halophilus]GEM00584.1 ribonuclease E [Halolactibacillus halophilus]SFO90630.1 ribonuclease G [Halolactibacillus halophilus]